MASVRPFVRPQQPVADEAPRMRKYENSGVLFEGTSSHPFAPILQGPCTIDGKKYRAKIFRNRGKGKNGEDVLTIIFESKEAE